MRAPADGWRSAALSLARLFDFQGRVSRIGYWRAFLRLQVASAALFSLSILLTMAAGWAGAVPATLLTPVLVANIAIAVRRLHDRNRSGWWLLAFLVLGPALSSLGAAAMGLAASRGGQGQLATGLAMSLAGLALGVWGWIEIGLLKSRPGPNRYGPAA